MKASGNLVSALFLFISSASISHAEADYNPMDGGFAQTRVASQSTYFFTSQFLTITSSVSKARAVSMSTGNSFAIHLGTAGYL